MFDDWRMWLALYVAGALVTEFVIGAFERRGTRGLEPLSMMWPALLLIAAIVRPLAGAAKLGRLAAQSRRPIEED